MGLMPPRETIRARAPDMSAVDRIEAAARELVLRCKFSWANARTIAEMALRAAGAI